MEYIFLLIVGIAGAAGLAGWVWWIRAIDRLSDVGRAHMRRIVFWPSIFGERADFTEEGWKYWIRARWAFALGAILALSLHFFRSAS